jgi:hypothetical protein
VSLEVSPRYGISENVALGGSWRYYRKSADSYRDPSGTLDAGVLAPGSERTEQRAMLSVTYSTMANYFRSRVRLPMEVSFSTGRVLGGAGNVPRQTITALSLRVYNQLF